MISLGQSNDGRLILASNQPFPSDVARIEYFRDQKLFMLIYEDSDDGSDLLPCEMSNAVSTIVKNSPDVVIIVQDHDKADPYGYVTPLIQIGH
jgi:hypothetical protein